jgi:pimeloyl-ACP methyl ester carboxylesterase
MKPVSARAPDGVTIAAQEWGNTTGPEILFIHGFNQCHLSWRRQVEDPAMAARFRMVTYDLRGHGNSDRPAGTAAYLEDRIWADDLAAVMAAADLKRPVLVAWSYAGRVVGDYLRTYGDGRLAGINYVNPRAAPDKHLFGPAQAHLDPMQIDDMATNIAGTRAFLRACFHRQPGAEDFEAMLAFNMTVPAHVRAAILGRHREADDALASIMRPVLVTFGREDQIILEAMADHVAARIKHAAVSRYDGIGHAPFWEDAPRFNAELAAFVAACDGGRSGR